MKNYSYSNSEKKGKQKRLIGLIVILCWLMAKNTEIRQSGWTVWVTEQMIPLLTYEKQCGSAQVSYEADYQVPEWFYEDESEGAINPDHVMAETTEEQEEKKDKQEKITTLADGGKGTTYNRSQLENEEFLLSNIFVVDANTNMTSEELSLSNLLDRDLTIADLKETSSKKKKEELPKILIYHTHSSESFCDSREGKKEDTIVGVGGYLTQLLEENYNIPVYHDETTYDVIDGVLDRSRAYDNAYSSVTKILQENPSIEVVIDLHRDGVDEETRLVTEVNGKPTAKVMFLNGVSRSSTNGDIPYLANPNKLDNLAFSFQMYLTGKEYYGDYVRKIYVRSYRYNLHLLPRTTLIEVGAQNNTVQEEKNAMEPLAAILDKVLSKK